MRLLFQNITGLLLFNGVNFWQVIEGPSDAIDGLMQNITADHRHNGFIVRFSETAEGRWFENWNLSYKRTSTASAAGLVNLTIPSRVRAEADSFMNLAH